MRSLHAATRQIQVVRGGAGENADELEDTRRDKQCRGIREQDGDKRVAPITCGSAANVSLEFGKRVLLEDLHLAVYLTAHGEEQRNHDVRLLEATARLPRHGQEARLDPNVRTCDQTHSKVTIKVEIIFILLLQEGRIQRQVAQIRVLHVDAVLVLLNPVKTVDENAVVDDGVDGQDHGHLAPGLHPHSLVVARPHTEGLSCDQRCAHARPIKGQQLRYARIVPDNLLRLQEILDSVSITGWRLFESLHLDPIGEDDRRDLDEVRQVPPNTVNTVLHAVHETQHETQHVHAGLQQYLHCNQDLRIVTHLLHEIRTVPGLQETLVLGRQQLLGQPLHMRSSVAKARR